MTTLQNIIEEFSLHWNESITLGEVAHRLKDKVADEQDMIKQAIMYALDEDGHTGEWKIKFSNDYIDKIYKNK